MKPIHHIQRIVAALILSASFIWAVVETESWFFLGVECLGYQFLCWVIIKMDQANEIEDELDFSDVLTKSESKKIFEISTTTPFTQREIYNSYIILRSFEYVEEATNLAIRRTESLIDVSHSLRRIKMKKVIERIKK